MLSIDKNHLIATDFYRLATDPGIQQPFFLVQSRNRDSNSCCKNRFLSIVNQEVIIGNYRLIDWFSDIGFYRLECTSQADKGL